MEISDAGRQERFLGTEQKNRKIRKMSDRKFVFDWDENEDTSKDINPLYLERHDAQLFGRGHFGGFDPKEQRKKIFYEKLVNERNAAVSFE